MRQRPSLNTIRHPRVRGVLCTVQVWRWAQQYRAQLAGPPLPEMTRLVAWLEQHVPAEDADVAHTRISHGDFR